MQPIAVLSLTHTPGASAPFANATVPVKQVWPATSCVGHNAPVPGVGRAGVVVGVGRGAGVGVAAVACVGIGVGDRVGEGEGDGDGVGEGVGVAVGVGVAAGVVAAGLGVAGAAVWGAALEGEALMTGVAVDAGAAGEEEAGVGATAEGGGTSAAVAAALVGGLAELPPGPGASGCRADGRHAITSSAAPSHGAIRRNRMTLPPTRD